VYSLFAIQVRVLVDCLIIIFPCGKSLWRQLSILCLIFEIFDHHGHCTHFQPIISCILQSSGKSSVLESIVGRDFLPRGSGKQLGMPAIKIL